MDTFDDCEIYFVHWTFLEGHPLEFRGFADFDAALDYFSFILSGNPFDVQLSVSRPLYSAYRRLLMSAGYSWYEPNGSKVLISA
jgi:hypothetical protein